MDNCKYKQKDKYFLLGIWILLLTIILVAYNPFQLYFLNDDFIYVPQSQGGNYLYGSSFRPVSDIMLYLDCLLYQKNAWGYHITNTLIHLIATLSIYHLAKRCFDFFKFDAPFWTAHLAAMFFLAYAFHSESIFWIIGRGGSMVTVFFSIALIMFLRKIKMGWYLLVAWLCFIAGILTYESMWIFPVIITILAYYKCTIYGVEKKRLLFETSLFWLTLIISFMVRKLLINDFIGSPYHYSIFSLQGIVGMVYKYATGFFRSFLFPAQPFYFIIGSCIILLSFLVFIVLGMIKKVFKPIDVFLVLSFLFTLTPICLLGVNTHNTESERFLYLPSVFVCVFFAVHISKIKIRSTRILLAGLFFGYNIFWLYQSSISYKIASAANKTAMQQIGKAIGNYDVIHVINLPSQYKGGFMFRLAFSDAIDWMCPNVVYKKMIVYSSVEYKSPKTIIPANTLPGHVKSFIKENHVIIDTTKDLLIAWDGDKLYIH